jgi:hypothetical protein
MRRTFGRPWLVLSLLVAPLLLAIPVRVPTEADAWPEAPEAGALPARPGAAGPERAGAPKGAGASAGAPDRPRAEDAPAAAASARPLAPEMPSGVGARTGDFFGVNWLSPFRTPVTRLRLDQGRALGARWSRFPIYWSAIQLSEGGPYNWAATDATIATEVANGFKLQPILLTAPRWARANGRPDLEAWSSFVAATVNRYKDRVAYWEIWNEPDLPGANGVGLFWQWSQEDYADLLRAGYRAVKAEDPAATVLLGGLALPLADPGWFTRLLDLLARDPEAAAHNYYFDVLALHQYGHPSAIYDLALGRAGPEGIAGVRERMWARGFDKPVWFNEVGMAVQRDERTRGPGQASAEEAADFAIQAFAYGLAAGVERVFIFQFYDDGAGTVDRATGNRLEFFGLVDNRGRPRPAYAAFQTAARVLGDPHTATRVNLGRGDAPGAKGMELITLYGTPRGKVHVVWNNDGGGMRLLRLPATQPTARLVSKYGEETPLRAVDGHFPILLPPATSNGWTCEGDPVCASDELVLGGSPYFVVEEDPATPAAFINSLPTSVRAPFTVGWRPAAPGVAAFDVQFMDLAEGGWRDWLSGVAQTAAQFDAVERPAQPGHSYAFRVRARDARGNLLTDYSAAPMASTWVGG